VNSKLSPARVLAARGIAVFGISQPLHDDRGTPSTDEDLHTFNFLNPESARSNFRQGAVDIIYQASMLSSQQHIFGTDHGEPEVALDPERVAFIGHSQGGLTGAIAAPFIGDIVDGFVLSGAGGGMSITLTQRKDVMDIEQMVKDLLEFSDNEDLTELHPVSGLVQVLTEVTDPMNYSAYWFKQEDWFTPAPVNLLLTEGLNDEQTPYSTSEALSASGGLPILEPVAHVSEAHELLGITSEPLPALDNGAAWDGSSVTVGLAQYPDDDHFAIFDNSEAADLYGNFLQSAIAGEAVLGE
jgi:pimeloyl-ACP methyl ester carboxylesterase